MILSFDINSILNPIISFINKNYLLLVIGISVLFVLLFVLMIAKKKKIFFLEFFMFASALLAILIHFIAGLLGYVIYWEGRQDLTWILFATILYFLVLVADWIILAVRLSKKEEAEGEEEQPEEEVVPEVAPKVEFTFAFDKYLDTIDEPLGFYDARINGYHLTKGMRELIDIKSRTLSVDEYKNFIVEDDSNVYEGLLKQKSAKAKYRYRLRTNSGIIWFEEVKHLEKDDVIATFHKEQINPEAIFDRNDLELELSRLISVGEEFGMTLILVTNNQNLIKHLGKEAANAVIENYLRSVQKDLFKQNDSIYKISSREYCILTTDVDVYRDNIHMVKSKNSELLELETDYEGKKYFVTNVLGFVHSESVSEKNSLEYVEAGRLALYIATNKECRYFEYDLNALKNNDLEFEKCKVDLSNKFLENL